MNNNTDSVIYKQLLTCVKNSLENENFSSYDINFLGKPEKGEGYLGEIVFVDVHGTSKENLQKSLHLVIKHGKNNEYLRKVSSLKTAFRKEIFLYEKVFPSFNKFQIEKNIEIPFEAPAKCYKTFIFDNLEVLVLENLKKSGYELRDANKPLNIDHLKCILSEYGKLHALSFAFRDQRKEEFNSLLDGGDFFKEVFSKKSEKSVFKKSVDEAVCILEENHHIELVEKLKRVLVNGSQAVFYDLVIQEEPQSVITHGDGWNNNFLFKYKDDDKTSPSEVKILDWQISALRSPAFDLSYLIYANSSHQQLERFEELLETYYTSFSNFLRQLGSNPEELFTYADLKRHWKKYSLFGALFMPTLLKFVLCKKEDAPALEDLKDGDDMGSFMSPNIGDADAYYERLKAVFTHYFEHSFK